MSQALSDPSYLKNICSSSLTNYQYCLKPRVMVYFIYLFILFSKLLGSCSGIWKHLNNTNIYATGSFNFQKLNFCTPRQTLWFHRSLLLYLFLLLELSTTIPTWSSWETHFYFTKACINLLYSMIMFQTPPFTYIHTACPSLLQS